MKIKSAVSIRAPSREGAIRATEDIQLEHLVSIRAPSREGAICESVPFDGAA